MKKFFSLLTLALLTMSAWASTTVTFDLSSGYANGDVVPSVASGDVTVTFDKGTNQNAPKWYTTGSALRLYGGNTATVASAGDAISKITFTFSTGDGNNEITCDTGDFNTPTWTGAASSVIFTVSGTSGHRRIAKIEVTLGEGGGDTPVDPTENLVESLEIAADMEDGVEFVFTGDAVVTYQYKQYLYVRDDTGYGLIYGSTNGGKNPVFAQGTILAPNWEAKTSIYNDELMEFVNTTGLDSCGLTTVAPEVITADQMADKLNAYVQIDHVKSISGTTATLTDGTTINLYNRFGKTIQEFSDADAIITGIVNIYNGNLQLYYIGVEGIVAAPEIAPASCDFEESVEVTITAEEGATIKYSYDNETWADYTEALTITETTTVYAKAVVGTKESNVVSATYTKVDPAEMVTYTLVTDASQLADGDKIILVGFNQVDSVTVQPYAMGAYRPKNFNFNAVEVTVEDNTVTTALANVITLEANGDNWNLKAEEGYLYAAGNSTTNKKNQLMVEDEPDADGNANAAIYITTDSMSIAFQGTNDRNFLRFNYNSGKPLFSCYAVSSSVQTPAYIFKANVEPAGLRGDVNNDENVDIADVTAMIDYLLSGMEINETNADADRDGNLNISDVTAIVDYLMTGNWLN